MKGLKIYRKGNSMVTKLKNSFFGNLPTEQDILHHVNSVSPEEAFYQELSIRGMIGLATGDFIPPMYSTPIKIGGSI